MTTLCFVVFDCKITDDKFYIDESGTRILKCMLELEDFYNIEYNYNIYNKTISFAMNLNNDCFSFNEIQEQQKIFKNFINNNFPEIINPEIYLLSGILKNKLLNSEYENFELNNSINLLEKIKI